MSARGHCHMDILAVALDSVVFYVYNFPLIVVLDIVCVSVSVCECLCMCARERDSEKEKEKRENERAGEVMWKDEGG